MTNKGYAIVFFLFLKGGGGVGGDKAHYVKCGSGEYDFTCEF